MVSLRGIPKRGQANVRKANKEISKNKMGRELRTMVKNGDSIRAMKRFLNEGGIEISRKTLERGLYSRYSAKTLSKYYARSQERFGDRAGFSVGRVKTLGGTGELKFRVRATMQNGETQYFDVFARVGQDDDFEDIRQKLQEIYEDFDEHAKSPIAKIEIL